MKVVGSHEVEFRRWNSRKGAWWAKASPNRTGIWIRIIYGVKFYPYVA